jgi:hypothetical protein
VLSFVNALDAPIAMTAIRHAFIQAARYARLQQHEFNETPEQRRLAELLLFGMVGRALCMPIVFGSCAPFRMTLCACFDFEMRYKDRSIAYC